MGINGQVALSASGSSCACPTAFTAHCPCQRIQRTQILWQVPALTCPEWMGCDRQDSIGLGLYRFRRRCWSRVIPSQVLM